MVGENDIGEVLKRAIGGSEGEVVRDLIDAMYNAMVDSLPESFKGYGLFKKEDLVIQALMDYAKQYGYLKIATYNPIEISLMVNNVVKYSRRKLSE
jgi:hypothetical protein